jgi:hypothetical protein
MIIGEDGFVKEVNDVAFGVITIKVVDGVVQFVNVEKQEKLNR